MVIADISIEFTCSREEMVRERIEDLHLERYQMTYEILSIAPGQIPKGMMNAIFQNIAACTGWSSLPNLINGDPMFPKDAQAL